jgi:membrane-associated phospholipid phosphatase
MLTTTTARADKLAWPEQYPRFRVSEYVAVGALLGIAIYTETSLKQRSEPGWSGPVLFDAAARNAFRLPDREQRESAFMFWLSDLTLHIPQFQPIVLDAGIAAARGSWETAWQIEMMSALGAGMTAALTRLPLYWIQRERPDRYECRNDPNYSTWCNRGPNLSHPSGHTSFAFTGATLSCAHHLRLHLWDSRAADIATCVAGMTLATTTAITRLMMDRHWATDVAAGALIGIGSGLTASYLLHYASFVQVQTKTARAAVLPTAGINTLGAQLFGMF